MEETIDASLAAAREAGKPLWVGEWGPPQTDDLGLRREQFQKILDLLITRQVQLSAVWVFDFAHQPLASIEVGTESEFMLDALAEANGRIRDEKSAASTSAKDDAPSGESAR